MTSRMNRKQLGCRQSAFERAGNLPYGALDSLGMYDTCSAYDQTSLNMQTAGDLSVDMQIALHFQFSVHETACANGSTFHRNAR